MLALDIFWWWVLARATNRKWVRAFVTIFMLTQTIGLTWLLSGRLFQTGWDRWLPKSATAAIFIWHLLASGCCLYLPLRLYRSFSCNRCCASAGAAGPRRHNCRVLPIIP